MANWGAGLSGGVGGATTGATIGSIIPGVGTAVGGAVGGLIGGISGLFGKKKKKKKPKPGINSSSLDPNQKQLNDEQFAGLHGQGPFSDLYNYNPEQANSVFDQTIGNPAARNFQEKIVPGITGSFRNQGLQNSSYVGDALSREGRDLQESLNGLRSKYMYDEMSAARGAKQNAIENYQNRNTQGFAPYNDTGQPKKPNTMDNIMALLQGDTGQSMLSSGQKGIGDWIINKFGI